MVTYKREFKERAVQMAQEEGAIRTARSLALFNISIMTSFWRSRAKRYGSRAHIGSGQKRDTNGNDEMLKLIKRNKARVRQKAKGTGQTLQARGSFGADKTSPRRR